VRRFESGDTIVRDKKSKHPEPRVYDIFSDKKIKKSNVRFVALSWKAGFLILPVGSEFALRDISERLYGKTIPGDVVDDSYNYITIRALLTERCKDEI